MGHDFVRKKDESQTFPTLIIGLTIKLNKWILVI